MAEIDKLECRVFGHSPWQALHAGVVKSARAWTAEVDGEPEAIFGVAPLNWTTGKGSPWLLGTDGARKVQRAFLTEAPKYLEEIEQMFPRLANMVSAKNTAALRWLPRLGFVIDQQVVLIRGEPMLHFRKGF